MNQESSSGRGFRGKRRTRGRSNQSADNARGGGKWSEERPPHSRHQYRGNQRVSKSFYSSTYKKEDYIHSNFRFAMKPGCDLSTQFYDPDFLVPWDDIVQVLCASPDASPSCPICLDHFTAPKISKCGHVFCWPCILRYVRLGQRSWRRCPICFDSITVKDLRSATVTSTLPPRIHTHARFSLLCRGSRTAPTVGPAATWRPENASGIPTLRNDAVAQYSRLNYEDPREIWNRERAELNVLLGTLVEAHESDSVVFVEEALSLLAAQERAQDSTVADEADLHLAILSPHGHINKPKKFALLPSQAPDVISLNVSPAPTHPRNHTPTLEPAWLKPEATDGEPPELAETAPDDIPFPLSPNAEEHAQGPLPNGDNAEDATAAPGESEKGWKPEQNVELPKHPKHKSKAGGLVGTEFIFYQHTAGSYAFPSPLDMRVLLHEFKSYANLPLTLSARIINVEEFSLYEEQRFKYRFLGHLPLRTSVSFCHLDLKTVVSAQTLKHFESELRARARRLKSKHSQESRLSKRQEATLSAKFKGDTPLPVNDGDSEWVIASAQAAMLAAASPPPTDAPSLPSFAAIARTGTKPTFSAQEEDYPALQASSSSSTSSASASQFSSQKKSQNKPREQCWQSRMVECPKPS